MRLNDIDVKVVVAIKRGNNKIYMRVKRPNIISITTPVRLSDEKIHSMLLRNYEKIKKVILSMEAQNTNKKKPDSIHYLGHEYKAIIKEDTIDGIIFYDDEVVIHTKNTDMNYVKKIIYKEYERTLTSIVNDNIESIKDKFKLYFEIDFRYKDVKSYFGKCFYNERRVILALFLAKYDLEYILSVIYHELAHFHYHDHQMGFYSLLEYHFPNYKEVQHSLRMIKYNDIC